MISLKFSLLYKISEYIPSVSSHLNITKPTKNYATNEDSDQPRTLSRDFADRMCLL